VFLQVRRRNAYIPESRASRLHSRIAGVSPASGCTQPPMSEVKISTAFLFALRQSAGETAAILIDFSLQKIVLFFLLFFC
jgi:hypothetical protein